MEDKYVKAVIVEANFEAARNRLSMRQRAAAPRKVLDKVTLPSSLYSL